MAYPNDGERATVEAINRHLPEVICPLQVMFQLPDSLPSLFVVEVTSCVPIQTVCLILCAGQDIRVVDIKRAPKSFDARIRCTGRRYEYIMPTFVLARKDHVLGLFDEVRLLAS